MSAPDQIPESFVNRTSERGDNVSAAGTPEATVDTDPQEPIQVEVFVPVGRDRILRVGVTELDKLDEGGIATIEGIAANLQTALSRIDNRQSSAVRCDVARALFDQSDDATFVSDTDGTLVAVNRAAVELTGRDRDALLTSGLPDVCGDTAAETVREHLDDTVSGTSEPLTTTLAHADDGDRTVKLTSQQVEVDGTGYVRTIAHDLPSGAGPQQQLPGAPVGDDAAALRRLNELTVAAEEFDETIERLLSLGCDHFGLDTGILSHVDGDDYEVDAVVDATGTHEAGAVYDLGDTMCEATLATDTTETLAFANVADTDYQNHPAAENVRAYIAAPVVVDGDVYGTVNFSMGNPRSEAFRPGEKEFTKLVAQWIGAELERRHRFEELARYETILEAVDDPVYALDTDGRFTFVNGAAKREFGYGTEIIGEPAAVGMRDADVEQIREQIEGLLATDRRSTTAEFVLETADGGRKTVENRLALIGDDEFRGTAGILRDITERKERRRQLEQFQRAIEEAADGIAVLDGDEYTYVDQSHVDMYGFESREQLLGNTWRELYDDDEIERLEREAFPALETEGHWRGMVTGSRRDGSTFPVELSLTIVGDGRLVCTARDETERRERKRELELKERAMDEASVGIQITDPTKADNPLVYVNDGFERMTGYTREEALGRNPRFLQGDDTDPEQVKRLRESIDAEEPVSLELRNERKDGTPYWTRVSVTPVSDESGVVENYIRIQQDVTERKKRERQTAARRDLLKRIYEVTTDPELTFEQKITELLEAGRDHLDLPYGFLTRIEEGEPGIQTIVEALGSHELLQSGKSAPLEQSYCRKTIEQGGFMTLTHAAEEGWADDLAYETFGLETYIGSEVVAGENLYGTLCFASKEPRETSFDEFERSFIRLVGRWIGYEVDRRDTRNELREQRERLELALSGTNTGLAEWDLATDAVTWNETLVDIVGRDVDTIEEFRAAVHPDDRERLQQELETMLETGDPWIGEFRMLDDDGDTLWLGTRTTPTYNSEEEPVRVLATGTDISSKKEAQRKQRRNERRFKSLFDDPGMLVGLLDTDGRLLDVNETAMQYVDATAEDLRGELFPETPWWNHSEKLVADLREWIQRAADGEYVEYTATHPGPDGTRRNITGAVRPVTDESGTVRSLFVTGRDVTERERQQRELLDRQRKLDLVLSNTDTSIAELDLGNATVNWDDMMGDNNIGSPETLGSFMKAVHAADRERLQSDLEEMIDTDEPLHGEYRLVNEDGETVWVAAQATTVEDGDEKGASAERIVAIATDVTDLKERERELEASQERYQTLLRASPDPVFVADAETSDIVEANAAAEEILGRPRDDIIGRSQTELHPDGDAELYQEVFEQSVGRSEMISELPNGAQPQLQAADGETIPVEINADTIEMPQGTVMYGVFRDISGRRERERELELKERAMDEANVGITISDPDQEDNPLIYANDGFVEQTGYTRADSIGRNCRFLQGEQTDSERVATLRNAVDNEESVTVQLRNYRKDGEMFWNRLSVTPIYDERGGLTNYIGIQQDVSQERRKEQELFGERERFRLLVESVDEYAFVIVGEDGAVQTWNESAEKLFGYDAEAAIGMQMSRFHPEEDRQSGLPERLLQQARVAGESAHEGWRVRADGSEFYADVRYAPLEADDGTFRGYAKIVRDMTDRRRQRRRTELFVEEAEDVVTVVDPDGTVTYASGSANRVLGYDPDDLVGENLFDYLHPDGREHAMNTFFDCVEGAEKVKAECRLQAPEGGWLNVEGRCRNMLGDDAIDGVLVYLRDVTESKERARRFESIFNQTFQFTGLLEPDGTVVEANDAALNFGGVDRDDIVGTPFFEVPWWTHSEDVYEKARSAIERAADGEFVRYETEVRGAEGLASIDFSVKPVYDDDDDVSLLVVEGRDVTTKQQQRQHLEVMQRVLRHNMRNDLTKMRGWTQIMCEEPDAEKRAEQLETVDGILDKWESMTEKMGRIRKITQSQGEWGSMEAGRLIKDAVAPVDKEYADATIVTDVSDSESTALDGTLLEAVRELVENAARASEDARVEVELTRPEEGWIEVGVRDNGPGLPDMEADVLETGEETPLNHGQGLGLWMVYMIVTQAGGDASVESTGDGTGVYLRVPAGRTVEGEGPTEAAG